jgi:hypothetical protein
VAADTIAILSAAIIIMLGLILNIVWTNNAAKNSRITRDEVRPNHTHSLRDVVDRIENKQSKMRSRIESIRARVDRIDHRLETVERLTVAQVTRHPETFQHNNEGQPNGREIL